MKLRSGNKNEYKGSEIPKQIHYCWFGRGEKGKLFKKCHDSWKKYFPDYEIIEWNEDNFDVNYNDYTKEAYNAGKYAFVSDVARLAVIYKHGGIYFDTDVEVIRQFPHEILKDGYFAEEEAGIINTGLGFATPKHNEAVKAMLEDYDKKQFIRKDKTFDMLPCPKRNSRALIEAGYDVKTGNKIAGIEVYGKEYFCGYDYKNHHRMVTDETLSIHHYAASWKTEGQKKMLRVKSAVSHLIGYKNYEKVKAWRKKLSKN